MYIRHIPFLFLFVFLLNACSDGKTYQVGIVKPMMVLNVTPGGADDVPLDSEVTVQFSDPVVEGSLTPETILLAGPDAAAVEAVFTYDGAENKLTMKPAKPFAYSAVYTLTITKKIKRKADKAVLAKEIVHTFRTIDPPNLTIVESAPSGNATSIGAYVNVDGDLTPYGEKVSTTVVIHFSEGLDKESVTATNFTLKDSGGVVVAGVFTWESTNKETKDLLGNLIASDDILTFTPDAPLKLSTVYTITLKGTFKGIISKRATEAGGWFAEDVVWTFRTIDPPPLGLVSSMPSPNAVNVGPIVYYSAGITTSGGEAAVYGNAVEHDVILSFTESVDLASFAAHVTVVVANEFGVPSTTGVPGNWAFSSSDTMSTEPWKISDTATFVPAAPWSLSGNYAVVINNKLESYRATDVSGSIERDITIAWETAHPSALQLVSTSPSAGGVNIGTIIYHQGATVISSVEAGQFGNVSSHTVVLRFNEAVNASVFLANVVVQTAGGTVVPGAWVPSNSSGVNPWKATDTWTFTPTLEWALSENYVVIIPAAVASYRATPEGGSLGQAYNIDWEEAHPLPLRVVSVTPSGGALDVGSVSGAGYGATATYEIVVRFSESVNAAMLSDITLTDLETSTVTSPFAFDSSAVEPWRQNDTVRFVLTSALSKNWRVNIPATLATYRATTESGMLGGGGVAFAWDMADPLPLFLENTFPGNGAEVSESFISDVNSGTDNGDEVNLAYTMWFSESVDRASLEASFSFIENGLDITGLGSFTYAGGDTAVTYTPAALQLSSVYQVTLAGGSIVAPFAGTASFRGDAVQAWYDTADDTGGYLAGDQTLWFTTPDPEALTIVSITPSVDTGIAADNIARSSSIVITFSEAVSAGVITAIVTDGPANIYARLTTGAATIVPAAYSFNGAGTVLTIDPVGDLDFSTEHELAILGGSAGIASWRVTSVSGWLVPTGTTVHKFKTVDPATLVIWATSPSDNDAFFGISVSDVAVDSDIQILFDQPVDSASFEAAFSMKDCGSSATNCATGVIVTPVGFTYPNAGQKAVVDVGPLQFDRWYEITILGGATGVVTSEFLTSCSVTCEGGYLPSNHVITFGTRSTPPLEVDLIEPSFTAGVGIRPRINVEFSTDVSLPTLTQFAYYITDETNNTLVQRYTDNVADYAVGATAEIVLLADLDFATRYSIVLQSSVQGTDGRFLGREVRLGFTTKLASLVISTDPEDLESAIESNLSQRDNAGGITVVFDGAVTTDTGLGITPEMAFSVTYDTALGVAVLLGTVDTTTPGVWIFNPDAACNVGTDPVDVNTRYYITLTNDVWRADGTEQLTAGYRSSFDTNLGPTITSVEAIADVPANDDLVIDLVAGTDSYGGKGASDVPVISTFRVGFSRAINVATVVAGGSLFLEASDAQAIDISNVQWSAGNTVLTFDVNDPTVDWVTKDLRFNLGHTLTLGTQIRDSFGTPMQDDGVFTFTTSKTPVVRFNSDASGKDQKYMPPVSFSTAFVPTTLVDSNFYVDESNAITCGVTYIRMPALLDYGYNLDSAALVPAPIMTGQRCHRVTILAGSAGPRDTRGNPFPGSDGLGAAYTTDIVTDNIDNVSDAVATATVVDSTLLTGRQQFRVAITTNNGRGNFLPTSISPNTFFVYANNTYTQPLNGHVYYDDTVDNLVFQLNDGQYFNSAASPYFYKLSSGLSTTLRGSCTAALCDNGVTIRSFTVENVQPTATFSPANGAINVEPNAAITVTFNEAVRPGSVGNLLTSLAVLDGGVPLAGEWTLNSTHTAATFNPDVPLNGGAVYTTSAQTGVLDYAGNTLVASTATFTVTTVGPTVSGEVPAAGATGIAVASDLVVTFNKKVAPASVVASLWGGGANVLPGSIRMNATSLSGDLLLTNNAASEAWACAYTDNNVVTFVPQDLLGLNTQYWWGLSTGITDVGGNALAAPYAQSFTTTP